MKKLMTTVAVLGCTVAIVSAVTVTSANTVGYSKKAITAGDVEIVSPQFLAGDAGGIVLSDAFSGVTDQAVVYIWNGSGYDAATYFAGYGWFDAIFTPMDGVLISQGEAVWLKGGSTTADVLMSGEVPMASSITNTLAAGVNMVANPYPVGMVLDDIPLATMSDGDVVYLWNGAGYDAATYFAGYGWFDAIFNPMGTTPVAVGQGFWLKSATGGDLIFNKLF